MNLSTLKIVQKIELISTEKRGKVCKLYKYCSSITAICKHSCLNECFLAVIRRPIILTDCIPCLRKNHSMYTVYSMTKNYELYFSCQTGPCKWLPLKRNVYSPPKLNIETLEFLLFNCLSTDDSSFMLKHENSSVNCSCSP